MQLLEGRYVSLCNDRAFQHPPKFAAPSAKDDRRRKSKNKMKKNWRVTVPGRRAKGPTCSRDPKAAKRNGGKTFPGSAAVSLMRALVMVAAIGPTTSCQRVPEGIAMLPFNHQFHLGVPVMLKRSVCFRAFVERYEISIQHNCHLNPCSAKQRTINPACVEKSDRSRKGTIDARESDAILAAQMLQSAVARELQGRSCPCNFCATVTSVVIIASVMT